MITQKKQLNVYVSKIVEKEFFLKMMSYLLRTMYDW